MAEEILAVPRVSKIWGQLLASCCESHAGRLQGQPTEEQIPKSCSLLMKDGGRPGLRGPCGPREANSSPWNYHTSPYTPSCSVLCAEGTAWSAFSASPWPNPTSGLCSNTPSSAAPFLSVLCLLYQPPLWAPTSVPEPNTM